MSLLFEESQVTSSEESTSAAAAAAVTNPLPQEESQLTSSEECTAAAAAVTSAMSKDGTARDVTSSTKDTTGNVNVLEESPEPQKISDVCTTLAQEESQVTSAEESTATAAAVTSAMPKDGTARDVASSTKDTTGNVNVLEESPKPQKISDECTTPSQEESQVTSSEESTAAAATVTSTMSKDGTARDVHNVDVRCSSFVIKDSAARDKIPQATEVCDKEPAHLMEHDEYALAEIKTAKVRFSIRRTNLHRHNCTPLKDLRLFDAVDDGVCIAKPGVKWVLSQHTWTVIAVACLGYTTPLKSKSAKVVDARDTRVTQVSLRSANHTHTPLLSL